MSSPLRPQISQSRTLSTDNAASNHPMLDELTVNWLGIERFMSGAEMSLFDAQTKSLV